MESNSAGGNPQRAMTSNIKGQSTQGNDTRLDGVTDAYPWLPNNIAYMPRGLARLVPAGPLSFSLLIFVIFVTSSNSETRDVAQSPGLGLNPCRRSLVL